MLTDLQLTEVALRFVAEELSRLAASQQSDRIGELLCQHYCTTNECGHDAVESAAEKGGVLTAITDVTAVLRLDLARYAAARNITLPA